MPNEKKIPFPNFDNHIIDIFFKEKWKPIVFSQIAEFIYHYLLIMYYYLQRFICF